MAYGRYSRPRRSRTYRRYHAFNRSIKGNRYFKKRMYGSKYSRKRITSLGKVFPRQCYQKLTYSDVWDLNCGGSTYKENNFRPTDLYDPDYTGVGGGFTGFSRMISIYNRWSVRAFKVSVTATNTCNQNVIVGMMNASEDYIFPTSGTTVQQEYLENNNGKYVLLAPTGTDGHMKSMRMYVKPKSIIGDTYRDQNFAGKGSANPTNWVFSSVHLANTDGTTTGATARVVVRITAYIKWTDRIQQPVD